MYNFLVDLFDKFNFRKIEWTVVVGNDNAEKMYDRIINKYGGKIVGVKEKSTKLIDNKYYDIKYYEIFKDDFERSRLKCKCVQDRMEY
jgi:RimJ/RimL family protein N-acetyltransferase